MSAFTESVVEDAALAWLEALGYAVLHGPYIAEGEPGVKRSDPNYRDVVRAQSRDAPTAKAQFALGSMNDVQRPARA